MLPFSRCPAALLLLRALAAALLLPAASCTAIKNHRRQASGPQVRAALEATLHSWHSLPPAGPATGTARTRWRASLGGLLTALENHAPLQTWTGTQSIQGWSVTFAGDSSGLLSVQPSTCERITAVNPSASVRKMDRRVSRDGDGLPVVMVQPRRLETKDPFFPPNGRYFPATLTAEFTGERKVTLTFHHTRNVESARVHKVERPLASELSPAIAVAMGRRFFGKFAFSGLVHPEKHLKEAGIYTPEVYDPKKIPLVLVHGLESAPHIWGNAMNEIAADPELRRHYQAWYFLYPTGITIQEAASTLRQSLQRARDYYDPKHRNPAMQQMVMAGHSMGGLLTQMQIIDSGDAIYRAFFSVPPEQLPFSRPNLDLVRKSLYFNHLPFVKRVVFIATPHRGSNLADLSIWRYITLLLRPTKILTGLVKDLSSVARTALNPKLARFRNLGSSTAEGLSPAHPLLAAIGERPIKVPYHSIIASFKPFGSMKPVEESSDGIVKYRSAWLPGAESTAVVNGFHTCADSQAVTRELMRILRLHAARQR